MTRPSAPGRRRSRSVRRPRRAGRALAGLALAGPLGLLPGAAAAPAPAAPTAEEAAGEVLVIMDVSGSMERKDGSGTTLIEGARRAVDRLVESAPSEAAVGLRLYGSEYAGDDEAVGCRDTELAVPIGPLSRTGRDISRAIAGAEPTGFTPIGYSLREAAGDFSAEGARSIVLVSDGEDTCPDPEPCAAARELADRGIDVRIDTVGLFLAGEPAARRQLACIAEATGGEFVQADDAADLGRQLTQVSTRAIESFRATGQDVDGGPAATRATGIEPGVAYRDDVGFGESRWYSFDAEEGQRLRVTLTEPGSTEYGCCLTLWVRDPDTDRVDSDNHYNTAGVAETYSVSSADQGTFESGTHYVEVTLDDRAGDKGLVEYEFTLEVEGGPSESPSVAESPTESPTPAESESPAAEDGAGDAADTPSAAAEAESHGHGAYWAAIGVLGVLVLALGLAVVLLLARRPAS